MLMMQALRLDALTRARTHTLVHPHRHRRPCLHRRLTAAAS